MSTSITPAILDTVLGHLAPHFLEATNGDLPTARHAASRMLAAHDPQTEEELHLATDIVSFGFHALEALSAAAAADLSVNQKIRLRGSAVSLNREAHKARRKLDQLRQARLAAAQSRPDTEPTEHQSTTDLIAFAQETAQAIAKQGLKGWTMSRQQRRAAERIAETLRRGAAKHERQQGATAIPPDPSHAQPRAAHA
jgi:hypothetical protein